MLRSVRHHPGQGQWSDPRGETAQGKGVGTRGRSTDRATIALDAMKDVLGKAEEAKDDVAHDRDPGKTMKSCSPKFGREDDRGIAQDDPAKAGALAGGDTDAD